MLSVINSIQEAMKIQITTQTVKLNSVILKTFMELEMLSIKYMMLPTNLVPWLQTLNG